MKIFGLHIRMVVVGIDNSGEKERGSSLQKYFDRVV